MSPITSKALFLSASSRRVQFSMFTTATNKITCGVSLVYYTKLAAAHCSFIYDKIPFARPSHKRSTGGLTWKDGNSRKLPFIYSYLLIKLFTGATCAVKTCFMGISGGDKSTLWQRFFSCFFDIIYFICNYIHFTWYAVCIMQCAIITFLGSQLVVMSEHPYGAPFYLPAFFCLLQCQ